MRFEVAPAVFARFPGLRLAVAVARDISTRDNCADGAATQAVAAEWRAAWERGGQSATEYGNAQSHPRIQPWRERFAAMGVSGKQFPSSAEALLRRAMKGGEPFSINPLVDFYNSVSLRHSVPAGAFDLGALAGLGDAIELRLSHVGDTFLALDEETPVAVPPGEVSYAVGSTILTRHFVWRQSRAGLVTPNTRDVFLVSEVLGELGPDAADDVLADFTSGLARHFTAPEVASILDETHPAVAWGASPR